MGERVFVSREFEVRLPGEEVKTRYGTLWNRVQSIGYFKKISVEVGFAIEAVIHINGQFKLSLIKLPI